jgi:hypothetical protein
MCDTFICVFDPADAQKLTDSGGRMASYDQNNGVWMFYNEDDLLKYIDEGTYVLTDVLTLSEGVV